MLIDEQKKYKITFPHFGKYHIPIKKILETLAGKYGEVIVPPPITKRTLELGTKHSPDFVCIPFKYNLGNYIEALEKGANYILQTDAGCRMGYYGEVQEQILRDLGYEFDFCIIGAATGSPKDFYDVLKQINPELTQVKSVIAFALAVRTVFVMDAIEQYISMNIGFEVEEGSFERLEKQFQREVAAARTFFSLEKVYHKYKRKFRALPVSKPRDPLKVGIVGEFYLLMEPYSNYYIEKKLAKFGIEVKRYLNLSYSLFRQPNMHKSIMKKAEKYLKYEIGADATDSVSKGVLFAEQGYDGIIHLKPFGCMPEINSMPMMQRISQDYKIPVLYFSFDSQTSETGINTRLEAFNDMINMKKRGVVV